MPNKTVSDEFCASATSVEIPAKQPTLVDQVIGMFDHLPATVEHYTGGKSASEAGFDLGFC